ncbi:hybrid sensor histidine kinase/response regulator [Lutibacter citreus]|uniref:hybrid sensor histidine kinase/response regulator n=1 Tax=Lutibacter citreus TaxID=2138210 RepID=UPI000DBE1F88|nr:ATP-binding protein [Lutibacter citreus]
MEHLLFIEDDEVDQMAIKRFAEKSEFNYTYELVHSIKDAKNAIKTTNFDAIISDYFLGDGNAFEILELKIDIPIIVTTGTGSEEIAVNALKMGAYDYLIKDIDGFYLKMLPMTVKNTLQRYRSEKELNKYHENLEKLVDERTAELKKEIRINKETSEDLLKMNMIFKNSNDATFMTDINGIITFINPKFTELYGYSPEEIIDKVTPRILKFDGPNNFDFNKIWTALLNKKGVSGYNHINKCKDGSLIQIESSFEPIINANDTLIGFISIQRDISKRLKNQKIQNVLYQISNAVNSTKNIQQLIKFIKNELNSIIDTTNFYIALFDADEKHIQLPFFQDEQDGFNTILVENSITEYIVKSKKPLLVSGDELKALENDKKLKISGTLPKQWLGVPIKIGELITGVIVVQSYNKNVVFTEDDKNLLVFISDQIGLSIQNKKIEQDLILALEKATESDKLKTAFLHNMSHEIRTPMNGILGFSNLLKNPNLSEEKQRSFIDIIVKSGERMLNTLNDLMDISKLETGQVQLNYVDTNINEELEILHSFFLPEASNKNLQLKLIKPKEINKIIINIDRDKLFAILSNLIKNAIKFTNTGSIELGVKLIDGYLIFNVSDTGIGIPKVLQSSIFDRFIQVDLPCGQVHQGSGLGLSISKSYVKMFGGEIWIESTENIGSSFYFTVPIN